MNGDITVVPMGTEEQVADCLTKSIEYQTLGECYIIVHHIRRDSVFHVDDKQASISTHIS